MSNKKFWNLPRAESITGNEVVPLTTEGANTIADLNFISAWFNAKPTAYNFGALSVEPTVSPFDGGPIPLSAQYYNTTTNQLRAYGSSGWFTPNINAELLAEPGGATLVGTPTGTVQASLDARPTSAALAASGGAALVGFDGDTVASRLQYSTRVQWIQSPDISDTVIARKKTAGATKLHIEPNGWVDTGTTAKLDFMGDSLEAVGDLESYRIGNFWFASDNPRGPNGAFNMNVKGRGNQFGIWPEWQFGFQDVASNAVCMKLYFFDTSDSAWRTPMKGMIRPGKAITSGDYALYDNKLYQAGTTGNCGNTPPTHTSGTVSDGVIDWTFVRDFSASSGSIKPLVFIGDQAEMPVFGFPNSRLQVATQQLMHNNRKISFVDIDGSVSYEMYARASDGKFVLGEPGGTKYMLFDKAGDVALAGMSFTQRVLSLSGSETTANVSNIEILRLAQSSPQLITAITGKSYNPFRVFGSLAGTSLRNGVNLALLSGEDYVVSAGEVLQFMTNSAGTGVYEVGTTYRPKYAAPGNAAFTTKPSPHCTVSYKAPITADRAVTLNATNPRAGEVVRVVRTAAATGAFNVNVAHSLGTKALTTGTNATFVYDGAAWELVDSGTV